MQNSYKRLQKIYLLIFERCYT